MAKIKTVEVLDNGTEIETTKDGWDKESLTGVPVQAAGWKEKAAPHFSIGLGLMKAVADSETLKDEYVMGNYQCGEELIPIIDSKKLTQDIVSAFAEKHDLVFSNLRLAGSRTGANKELAEVKSVFADIDPEAMKILEQTNPDAYAKIMGFQQ